MRFALVLLLASGAYAQIPEIPTVQVCNATQASTGNSGATVSVAARTQTGVTGTFSLRARVTCTDNGYPDGTVGISVSMSDSTYNGLIESTNIEQVTSTGKHTPMAFINGRCKTPNNAIRGCRFWLLMADNRAQDIAAFLVVDQKGQRIAYGSGPVRAGDITIAGTGN